MTTPHHALAVAIQEWLAGAAEDISEPLAATLAAVAESLRRMAAVPEHPQVAEGVALLEQYRTECGVLSAALEQQDRAAVQGSAARLDAIFEQVSRGYARVALRLDTVEQMVEELRQQAPDEARFLLERALDVWAPAHERLAALPADIAPHEDVRAALLTMQQAFAEIVEVLTEVHANVQAPSLAVAWARLRTAAEALRALQQHAQSVMELNQPLTDPRRGA